MFKVKFKLFNLDKPNKNGWYVSKECMDKLVTDLLDYSVPVRVIDDNDIDTAHLIGRAQVSKYKYPSIVFEGSVSDDIYKQIMQQNRVGCGLCGIGEKELNGEVNNFKLKCLGVSSKSAAECSLKVEDNKDDN